MLEVSLNERPPYVYMLNAIRIIRYVSTVVDPLQSWQIPCANNVVFCKHSSPKPWHSPARDIHGHGSAVSQMPPVGDGVG